MSQHENLAHLEDTLRYGNRVMANSGDRTAEELEQDPLRVSGILYDFAILGEAARRLGREFHDAYPSIPWKDIVGFRNVLVHDYDRIDTEELIVIVQDHLPNLLMKLKDIITDLEGNKN